MQSKEELIPIRLITNPITSKTTYVISIISPRQTHTSHKNTQKHLLKHTRVRAILWKKSLKNRIEKKNFLISTRFRTAFDLRANRRAVRGVLGGCLRLRLTSSRRVSFFFLQWTVVKAKASVLSACPVHNADDASHFGNSKVDSLGFYYCHRLGVAIV